MWRGVGGEKKNQKAVLTFRLEGCSVGCGVGRANVVIESGDVEDRRQLLRRYYSFQESSNTAVDCWV